MSQNHIHTEEDNYSKTILGFWLYLLTDFILFGTLFATYAVLRHGTYGGPGAKDLFVLPYNLLETLIILLCAFTSGMGGVMVHRKDRRKTIFFFAITFFLGCVFTWMQLHEFSQLISTGNDWRRNAFLSAYFTLVGTHVLHMIFALVWTIVFLVPVCQEGICPVSERRVTCLRMFWQFLNIIWLFIFSIVYLLRGC